MNTEQEIDFALAAENANKALTTDYAPWAKFFHSMARFYFSRAFSEEIYIDKPDRLGITGR